MPNPDSNSKKTKSEFRRRKERELKIKKFKSFFGTIGSSITDLSSSLNGLFWFPFTDLKRARKSSRSTWPHYLLMPLAVIPIGLAIVGKILISPLEVLVEIFRGRFKRLLWRLPALFVFIALVVSFANGWWGLFGNENQIKNLLVSIESKMGSEDVDGAVADYEELFELNSENDDIDSDVHMGFVDALIKQGNEEKAGEALNKLAPGPDGIPGIEAAHLMIAIKLANQIKAGVDRQTSLLRWHLEHSGEPKTLDAFDTWALFSLATEDVEEAIKYYRRAAGLDPIYFMVLADLYARTGKFEYRTGALADARMQFEQRLKEDPRDENVRLVFADILSKQEKFDECETVLVEGKTLSESLMMKEACSNFYVGQYVRFAKERSFTNNSELLQKAFELAPDSRFVQRAINNLYVTTENPEEKASIIEALEIAARNKTSARNANFILSVLLSQENKIEDAIEYSEKVYQANPESPACNNNLAWQLAHAEIPDLDRALKLARFAVESSPNNGSFRDTLGTVLVKSSKHKEAISELEKALWNNDPPVSDAGRISIREQLAICYEEIGLSDMAKKHLEKAAIAKAELEQSKASAN